MTVFDREPINFQQTFAEAQSIVSASERYKRALENVKMRPRFPMPCALDRDGQFLNEPIDLKIVDYLITSDGSFIPDKS